MAGLNNSMNSLSKNALDKLNSYIPVYDEQWKYTNINLFDKFDFNTINTFSDLEVSDSLLNHLKLENAIEKNTNNVEESNPNILVIICRRFLSLLTL